MKTLIVGCGYFGTRLGKVLLEKGHQVWGIRRDPSSLVKAGIQPLAVDISQPELLKNLPVVDFVVFCQALTRQGDDYATTYSTGTRNVVGALKGKPKLLFISSTGVYAAHDGGWIDESTDPAAGGYVSDEARRHAEALLDAEKSVLNGGFPGCVFRLGGLYGPGRHRLKAMKEGTLKTSFSSVYVNRIHVDDAVAGAALLLEKGEAGQIYLGVDDEPATHEAFSRWVRAQLGLSEAAPEVDQAVRPRPNKRCSNKKIKALGLRFRYPTFREGYSTLLREA